MHQGVLSSRVEIVSAYETYVCAADRSCAKGETPTEYIIWRFPKIRGTFLGVPMIRTIVYWGLYWGPLILGNYHIGQGSLFSA